MKSSALITVSIALSLSLFNLTAHADTLGFRLGGYSWDQEFDGEIKDGTDFIDLDSSLGIDDESNNVLFFALEHPIPVLPNILIQQSELEASGDSTLTEAFEFDDGDFDIADDIVTDIDLSHTDLTLYYEVLDNWVNLDLGLTVRKFDGSARIALLDGSETAEEDLDAAVPLIYAAAKFELPLTGTYVSANINTLSAGDASITDLTFALGYESDFGLGIEIGTRAMDLDYEDDEEEADIEIDGKYINLFYHF